MKDQHVTGQDTPSPPTLNRAQRRQLARGRRRAVMGQRTTVKPYHQSWAFAEHEATYTVTVDVADDAHTHPSHLKGYLHHQVTALCIDDEDNVHGTWRSEHEDDDATCVHALLAANHALENDGLPWLWGDSAA